MLIYIDIDSLRDTDPQKDLHIKIISSQGGLWGGSIVKIFVATAILLCIQSQRRYYHVLYDLS